MRTGLLSLNIHDSLTFDGAELCLHPDLFAVAPSDVGGGSQPTKKASDENASNVSGVRSGVATAASSVSGTTVSNHSTPAHLAVGDFIEVRVWDPLPKEQVLLKSPSGNSTAPALRKNIVRASPPTTNSANSSVQVEFPNTTAIPDSIPPPSSAGTSTNLRPRADSLAYSDGENSESKNDASTAASSSNPDKPEGSVATESVKSGTPIATPDDGQETSPAKTVAMPSSLPPVFPRSRANTADVPATGNSGLKAGGLAKPPMLQRRTPSASGILQSQSSPKPPRHTRQISDMTMETHQLDIGDIGIHPADSQDDEATQDHTGVIANDEWSKVSSTHKLRLSFVLLVTEKTLSTIKGNTRTQISILRQAADLYNLSSYDTVTVHKIDARDEEEVLKAVSADFVVVTIKDQFISRGDMHLFQSALQGTWIYEGQRLYEPTRQLKAHAREIRHGNYAAKSGIVTEKTMITFRSRSSRIFWLVQLSSEMWDYASPYEHKDQAEGICEIYFDQWIRFLYKLFEKWKALEVTHCLTVIFFSRTFLSNGQKSKLNCQDVYGRSYEDHYKPVIENEICVDWESLVVRIKEEFVKYPLEVGWNLSDRRPSSASQGNVLEAVNVTLNVMQHHFLDRDLHRTGNSIVVVSPGCGVFEVDKGLAGITYQRMMDNGIGSDMLSLSLPPLHIAPFFLYNNEFRSVETRGVDTSETYYEVPHWMHLSFISYDREEHQLGDHIHSEERKTPTVKLDGLDAFEVGPNGFLRPRQSHHTTEEQSEGHAVKFKSQSSSFSALGNKAATPGKAKSQQERQLISGRDFRDILEACRPRMSGVGLPSALAAILRQQTHRHQEGKISATPQQDTNAKNAGHLPLREWGTVEFDAPIRQKPRALRSESPSSRRSPNEIAAERGGEGSEGGSVASSFASHVSSMFGMSYDRVLWDHYESPVTSKVLLQIQRSPSLEFSQLNPKILVDMDSTFGDDAVSVSTDNASKGSTGQASSNGMDGDWSQNDNDTSASPQSRQEKHLERLQKLMDAHDAQVWAPMNTKVSGDEIKVVRPESLQKVDSEVTLASGKRGQTLSGGLGAALSQYSNTLPMDAKPNTLLSRRGSFVSSQNRLSMNKDRARAQSPAFPSFQDRSARAMSPLLMPPMLSQSSQNNGGVDPPSYLHPDRDQFGMLHRPLMIESSSSLSRDNIAPIGIFSSGNFEYGGMNNSMGSFTLADGSRHLLRPIARSPQGSSFRQFSRSPPGIDSARVGSQLYGSSPPNIGLQRERVSTRPANKEVNAMSPPSEKINRARGGRRASPARKDTPENARSKKKSREGAASNRGLRQQKACNPFRQSDEDEVLAKRSHNRRRWSHVFPVGEVEFKRHSGPIWNSLTAPAILPLSVDYFPSPQELRDERRFQFNPYTVTLGGIENKHYSTHAELMLELVLQRVTQDFQIVTNNAVRDSESRPEPQRQGRRQGKSRGMNGRREAFVPSLPTIKHDTTGTIKHYLSMGHRIQVLSYDPSSDTIEIVHYNRKSAQNDPVNVYSYRFMMFSKVSQFYAQSVQTFKKYAEPYKWSKVDNLICGEEERQLEVGMRFRRIMFGLIPEKFQDKEAERDYISKFQRLVEYLGKLRDKGATEMPLDVKIVSSEDWVGAVNDIFKVRSPTEESMLKFTIQLKKGKRDPFEWIEIAIDSTFDTSKSYRIMFNWLVASSAKVETQVQLLKRRCVQFGLNLLSFPQTTISRDLFLHVFAVPTLLTLRSKSKASHFQEWLRKMDFIEDGIRFTNAGVLDCIERSHEFDFPRLRSGKIRSIPSRQFVHRSGALFVREIRDKQGWSILAGIENYRHSRKENESQNTALELQRLVAKAIRSLHEDRDLSNIRA